MFELVWSVTVYLIVSSIHVDVQCNLGTTYIYFYFLQMNEEHLNIQQ